MTRYRRRRAGGALTVLILATVLSSCQGASIAGSAAIATPTGPATVTPVVTSTATRTVIAPSKVRYQVAGAPPTVTVTRSGQTWWGIPVDVDHHSSLTVDDPVDDSNSVYIQPTTALQPKNAANLPDSGTGKVWPGRGLSGRTNGQIIGIQGDQAYTCSGTVIHSAARNVVVTAGHCVWNIPVGKPHSKGGNRMTQLADIWFVPGAAEISRPLRLNSGGEPELDAPDGIWRVDSAHSNQRWLENTWITQTGAGVDQTERMHGDGSYDDVAFLTLGALGGQQIEEVTGAQGVLFTDTDPKSPNRNLPTVVVGYPAAAPFDGSVQRFCAVSQVMTYDLTDDEGGSRSTAATLNCNLTPGASGGAWFTGFDQVDGVGYVYGVTSSGGDGQLSAALLSLSLDYPLYQSVAAG